MINQFKCYPKYHSGWGKKINFLQTSLGILLFSQRKKKFSLCVCMSLYVFIFWSSSNRSSTEASNNYHLFGLPLKKYPSSKQNYIIDLIYINILNFKKSVTKFSRVFSRFDCYASQHKCCIHYFLFIKY